MIKIMKRYLLSLVILFSPLICVATSNLSFSNNYTQQLQSQFQQMLHQQESANPIRSQLIFTKTPAIQATLTTQDILQNTEPYSMMLYAFNPPMMKRQNIRKVTLTSNVVPKPGFPVTYSDTSPMHKPALESQFAFPAESVTLKTLTTIDLDLMKVELSPLKSGQKPAAISPLPISVRQYATRASALYDFNTPAFKDWLDKNNLHPAPNENTLMFARRVYIFIENNFSYYYQADWDRSATNTIATGKTDCGGFSILFGSVMRYHGIPAFSLIGRWAYSGTSDYPYMTHVKQEFYLDNIGWVPSDVTSGVLFKQSSTDTQFFAKDPGDLIVFQIDPDMSFDTFYGPQNLIFFQFPASWYDQGTMDDQYTETWNISNGG